MEFTLWPKIMSLDLESATERVVCLDLKSAAIQIVEGESRIKVTILWPSWVDSPPKLQMNHVKPKLDSTSTHLTKHEITMKNY